MIEEINIEKVILHILDPSVGLPVFSEGEHTHNNKITDFMEPHIKKAFNEINIKNSSFQNDDNKVKNLAKDIAKDSSLFIENTRIFAQDLYNLMKSHENIPPCDLICSLFEGDEKQYLGFFIFNYRTSYIHYVEESESGRLNTVIAQTTTLPNTNQKINEFFIIDLEDYSIGLKEKKYDINGEREYYLSKYLLESVDVLSDKNKLDIVDRVTKKIVKDHYEDDHMKLAEIKTAMSESLEESNLVDLDQVKEKVFKDNLDIQNLYDEEIEKKGVTDKKIKVNPSLSRRISKKQKLVLDNGIEINFPIEHLNSDESVEFLNNSDGTISVLLKNIKNIEGK